MPNPFDIAEGKSENPFDLAEQEIDVPQILSGPSLITPEAQSIADRETVTSPFFMPSGLPMASPDEPGALGLAKEILPEGLRVAGDITRSALTDAVAGYTGAVTGRLPQNSGNLYELMQENELPADIQNRELSQTHPAIATFGKIGQGVIGTAPLLAVGAGLPAWGQRLLAAGFSADMIRHAPEDARQLGEELGKNKEDQDRDKITTLSSGLIQTGVFAPLAGAHALRPSSAIKLPEREVSNAAPIRSDAGQIPASRNVGEGSEIARRQNLQQPTPEPPPVGVPEARAPTQAEIAAELGLKPDAAEGGMWQFSITTPEGKTVPFAVKEGASKADIAARAETLKSEFSVQPGEPVVALEPAPEQLGKFKETSGLESWTPEYFKAAGDNVFNPDWWVSAFDKIAGSKYDGTGTSYQIGKFIRFLGEEQGNRVIDALEQARERMTTEIDVVKKDPKNATPEQVARAMKFGTGAIQLPREAWEAALDTGSAKGELAGQPIQRKSSNEKAQTQEVLGQSKQPSLVGSRQVGNDIYLEFDAARPPITAAEIKRMFAGTGRSVDVISYEPNVISNAQGRAKFKVIVSDESGAYSEAAARKAYADIFGSDKPVMGKSSVEQSVPLKERLSKSVQHGMEQELGLSAEPLKPNAEPVGLGAATPAEFAVSPKTPTGIKNATVDVERQQRGLPPAVQPARRAFGKVWDEAMAKVDHDPGSVDRLVNELRYKPRALTDLEDATMLHRQIDLQNEYGKATRDLAQAYDDGRMDAVPGELARVNAISDQLLDLYNITKKVGTETGRGLNARKMMAYEDFTLAKMELEKRAANEGRPLTPEERTELVKANEKIAATQKAFDEYVAKTDQQLAARDLQAALDEMQKGVKSSKPTFPKAEDIEAQKQKIRLRINEGERSDISSLVQRLARMFVEQGIKARDPLIDSVHNVLKEIDPEFTRRETMDAISGYGDFRQLTKDEISVKLRDLKGQMQQVAKLEDMQANKPPLKTGVERRIPSTEESRLIRLVNEAKNQFQIPITDPNTQLKSSLDTLKARLKNKTAEWEDRLKRGDFAKKPKRVIQMDTEANQLHFENAQAKAKWHEALMKDRLARRSLPQKIFGGTGETVNTARAVMTSFDLSGVLRQGGFIALAHPFRAARSIPAMLKAFGSEAAQHATNREITYRKNYPLMAQSKLYLSEHGQKLSQMEEAYMSRWADKIPIVAGSQRAYTTFLNKLRADSFDAMANSLSRTGELTPAEGNAIANFINVATGRGNLGMRDNALVGMNTVFFAPRYVASRFQLALGQPLYRGTARTREAVAKEYARYLAGLGVVYALGQQAGAEVETDPRSADFGKMRWGNTRLDPMSGLSQTSVLMSRLVSGETKTLAGEIKPIRGPDVPFGSGNSADVMARFLRTKLAPAPGAIVDMLTGKDVVGQPVTATSTAQHLMTPLAMRDIYNAMLEQGVPEGTALGLLSILGMGLQTYEDKK